MQHNTMPRSRFSNTSRINKKPRVKHPNLTAIQPGSTLKTHTHTDRQMVFPEEKFRKAIAEWIKEYRGRSPPGTHDFSTPAHAMPTSRWHRYEPPENKNRKGHTDIPWKKIQDDTLTQQLNPEFPFYTAPGNHKSYDSETTTSHDSRDQQWQHDSDSDVENPSQLMQRLQSSMHVHIYSSSSSDSSSSDSSSSDEMKSRDDDNVWMERVQSSPIVHNSDGSTTSDENDRD
jgi:hypothetical protein